MYLTVVEGVVKKLVEEETAARRKAPHRIRTRPHSWGIRISRPLSALTIKPRSRPDMTAIDERFTEQFRQWERRGRGWQVFDEPVYPEPPLPPFPAIISLNSLRSMTGADPQF